MNQERRNYLNKSYLYSVTQFDKLLVYLSSGALVLSVGFIENIITLNKASCLYLLIFSWILFAVSLFSMLFSHMYSFKSIQQEMKVEGSGQNNNSIINLLNNISIISLGVGVVALIIFISINII